MDQVCKTLILNRSYEAYEPIIIPCLSFMFIKMKSISCHSYMMFVMKSMSIYND